MKQDETVDSGARDAKMQRRQQQETKDARNSSLSLCLILFSFLLFFHEFKFNFRVPFLTFGLVPFPNTSSFFPHTPTHRPFTSEPRPSDPMHTSHVFLPTSLPWHILHGIGLLPSLH